MATPATVAKPAAPAAPAKRKRAELTPEQQAQRTAVRHAKFVELAEHRVGRAIRYIRVVGNLANRNQYHYSEDEWTQLTDALYSAVQTVIQLGKSKQSAAKEFSFKRS